MGKRKFIADTEAMLSTATRLMTTLSLENLVITQDDGTHNILAYILVDGKKNVIHCADSLIEIETGVMKHYRRS